MQTTTVPHNPLTAQDAAFVTAVHAVAQRAHVALPLANGRIERAVEIVLSGGVELFDDGHAVVQSQSRPHVVYACNGNCACDDAQHAPHGQVCKHRLAARIQQRAQEEMGTVEAFPELEPAPTVAGIAPEHLVEIQGKRFVKFVGLLALAHARGLSSLTADWTYNDAGLSLAHAVAVFPFGRFEESGDAAPESVSKQLAPHFRRIALTRAKARCLRDALNIGMVSVEELAD
jgi:hypothetical protein